MYKQVLLTAEFLEHSYPYVNPPASNPKHKTITIVSPKLSLGYVGQHEDKKSVFSRTKINILLFFFPIVLFWNGVLLFSEHGLPKEKSLTLTHASRPDRLRDIADRFNVDHEAVLDNVLYARAYTSKTIIATGMISRVFSLRYRFQ